MSARYIEIDGHKLPAVWEICHQCSGDGVSSAHLGAYSREEFDQAFDPEEQEAYFRGDYDERCNSCKGFGKTLEIDLDKCTKEQERIAHDHFADLNAAAAERHYCGEY